MRAVIQRCTRASVTVDGEVISSIGRGFMVLIGIGVDDTLTDSAHLIKKILSIRLFDSAPALPSQAPHTTSAPPASSPSPAQDSVPSVDGDDTPVATAGKMWKSSIVDVGGQILCELKGLKPDYLSTPHTLSLAGHSGKTVSQFTLMARTERGSKPDFHQATGTAPGKAFYETFLADLRKAYVAERVEDGKFGAMMEVSLVNDGPVTITLDSKNPKNLVPPVASSQGKAVKGKGAATPPV